MNSNKIKVIIILLVTLLTQIYTLCMSPNYILTIRRGVYMSSACLGSSIGIKTPKRLKKHHKTDVSSTPLLLI